jgi:hypothetical protein
MEWRTKDISRTYKMSFQTIQIRARALGIKPIIKNNRQHHIFTKEQVYDIVNYPLRISKPSNVFYINQIFHIYESKMNYE